MIAPLNRPSSPVTAAGTQGEIWRGLVDGFATILGTCEALDNPEPPPASAALGIQLDCIPVFSPTPCPPLCPDDPPQPVGQLILPTATGGGFRAALFLLGLVQGTGITSVALGLPAGCGATFANSNCAVAGC